MKKIKRILIIHHIWAHDKYYQEFGDILIVDATYKVNKYSLPFVILSGFTHTGKKCIFGVGIINDETEKTYSWIFKQFFNILTTPPKFIVTDRDLSTQAVISKEYATSIKYHLNCPWHVQQNFKKNFSYLATIKLSEIKDKIVLLPFIYKKEEFESNFEEIIKTLKQLKLEKSMAYLNNQLLSKEKWTKAYLPMEFTGGVHTTSRAESINSLIKRHVDSRSEIVDFWRFLIDYEHKSCSNEPELVLDIRNQYEKHPIFVNLKKVIFGNIYEKHVEQFTLSHNYYVKMLSSNELNQPSYEVKSSMQ